MATADFMARMVELQNANIELMRMKNADYANIDDPFANFKLCEEMGLAPTEVGLMVRMTDKVQRVANLIFRDAQVQDETIYDALSDLANYALILRVYLEQKRK
jgi:hypothetical protein